MPLSFDDTDATAASTIILLATSKFLQFLLPLLWLLMASCSSLFGQKTLIGTLNTPTRNNADWSSVRRTSEISDL